MSNRKVQYSKKIIESTFLELACQIPPQKISVSRLCFAANVNRSTFYAHYLDIFDLMEQITDRFFHELFSELVQTLDSMPFGAPSTTVIQTVTESLHTTLRHRELCHIIFSFPQKNDFFQRLLDSSLSWCLSRYDASSIKPKHSSSALIYRMMLGGILSLWIHWIESDFQESPEELAKAIHIFLSANITTLKKQ